MIPRDWVISIVNPIEQIVQQYQDGLSGVGKAPEGYLSDEDSLDDDTDNELEEQPDSEEGVDLDDAYEDESTGYYDPNEIIQGYTDEQGNPVDLVPETVEYDPTAGPEDPDAEWDGPEGRAMIQLLILNGMMIIATLQETGGILVNPTVYSRNRMKFISDLRMRL